MSVFFHPGCCFIILVPTVVIHGGYWPLSNPDVAVFVRYVLYLDVQPDQASINCYALHATGEPGCVGDISECILFRVQAFFKGVGYRGVALTL